MVIIKIRKTPFLVDKTCFIKILTISGLAKTEEIEENKEGDEEKDFGDYITSNAPASKSNRLPDFKKISPKDTAKLITESKEQLLIVDCRYKYEYQGKR